MGKVYPAPEGSDEERPLVEIVTVRHGRVAVFKCPSCGRQTSIELGLLHRSGSVGCLCGAVAFEMSRAGEPDVKWKRTPNT